MAPKAVPAAIVSPNAEGLSDDSVSPSAAPSVQGRQQRFMAALEEASQEAPKGKVSEDVFPYGITVPFKVRDAVPGNKCGSARVFLAEAPIQALKDMCFYLQLEEAGSANELVERIVDYFTQLYPERAKAMGRSASQGSLQEKLASRPTPARGLRKSTGGSIVAKTSLNKENVETKLPSKENIENKLPAQKQAEVPLKKLKRLAEEEPKVSLKRAKTTEKLQDDYCVAGLSIAQQLKLAMKASMEA